MSRDDSRSSKERTEDARIGLGDVLSVQLLVTFFYLGMEWLFFATKASFMDSFSRVERFGALLIPTLALNLLLFPLLLLLQAADRVLPRLQVRSAIAAWLLASSFFLLFDNFLYTVLGVGVVTSVGLLRIFLLLLFLFLLVRSFGWSKSLARQWGRLPARHPLRLLPILLLAGGVIATGLAVATTDFSRAEPTVTASGEEERRPNIIILSSDGVEARLMSVYGFRFPTTPFLERFGARSLVFENAFPNAGKTTGTLSSMLAGSLPSELKVGFPPHIFPQRHAALHLPAILQQLGYRGFQSSVRYYADAGDLNMINSFDFANGRPLFVAEPGSCAARLAYLFSAEIQFSSRLRNRIWERLLHIFRIRPIINHYLLVKEGAGLGREVDRRSLSDGLAFLRRQEGPYFLQIHLMGTHCCGYGGARRWFDSVAMPAADRRARAGQARYLDSIRDADQLLEEFITQLEASGELERSIVVFLSDHSQKWDSVLRVPLIVHFPGDLPRGRVTRNVSLAQLPATLLDYMGIEQPTWMSQPSLLAARSPEDGLEAAVTVAGHPPILSLASFDYSRFGLHGGVLSRIDEPGPPLFGVRKVGIILGPIWKKLDLRSGEIETGPVSQHAAVADRQPLPSDTVVMEYITRHLEESGFTLPSSVRTQ